MYFKIELFSILYQVVHFSDRKSWEHKEINAWEGHGAHVGGARYHQVHMIIANGVESYYFQSF